MTPQPATSGVNPFGLLLGADGIDDQYRVELAKALGVSYFRPWYVNVEAWNGACYDLACDSGPNAGLKLILTVRNNVGEVPPFATTPPQDGAAYRRNLSDILTRYHPEVLVVENEEDSAQYWSGTPEQYGALLKAACQVAHDQKIPCANGGLSSKTTALLVWADYVEHQQVTEACSFVQRASAALAPDLCRFTAIDHLSAEDRTALNIGRKLLEIYRSSGQDYLNFHWYIPDKSALSDAVNYLRRVTDLPVMSNEIGQTDQSLQTMQKLAARLPLFEVYNNIGALMLKQKKYKEAIDHLKPATDAAPRDTDTLFNLGYAYFLQKDYANAESVLKKAEANDPGNLGVQYNLGLLYESTNRFEQARVIFERLSREDPEDENSWLLLGAALDGLGREPEHFVALPFVGDYSLAPIALQLSFYEIDTKLKEWASGFLLLEAGLVGFAGKERIFGRVFRRPDGQIVQRDSGYFAKGVRRARKLGLPASPVWSDRAANWCPLGLFCGITIVAGLWGGVRVDFELTTQFRVPADWEPGAPAVFCSACNWRGLEARARQESFYYGRVNLLPPQEPALISGQVSIKGNTGHNIRKSPMVSIGVE